MGLERGSWYRCDRCGTDLRQADTDTLAAMYARDAGWHLSPAGDLCGQCWQAVMHGDGCEGVHE